eukprot:1562966-Karenia_brevis.AAC.1
MIWNPALEARPHHICELYGENRGAEIKHVVLKLSQQGSSGSTDSSVQSTGGAQDSRGSCTRGPIIYSASSSTYID